MRSGSGDRRAPRPDGSRKGRGAGRIARDPRIPARAVGPRGMGVGAPLRPAGASRRARVRILSRPAMPAPGERFEHWPLVARRTLPRHAFTTTREGRSAAQAPRGAAATTDSAAAGGQPHRAQGSRAAERSKRLDDRLFHVEHCVEARKRFAAAQGRRPQEATRPVHPACANHGSLSCCDPRTATTVIHQIAATVVASPEKACGARPRSPARFRPRAAVAFRLQSSVGRGPAL